MDETLMSAGFKPGQSAQARSLGYVMYTLNTTEQHAVAYAIGSYHSNAWKSSNPNSGVYIADVAKTLDCVSCGDPGCNQGGIAVVEVRND